MSAKGIAQMRNLGVEEGDPHTYSVGDAYGAENTER
jgi:hypothetical protein